ncbi:MAG: acetaldehyde dehydrogenase (acetylating) [Oscillospiraceae bacterium]|nr:acetaldehyde dehydrogenase (acetylating) [Oscillospiraceae bacterium]
MDRDLQSIQEVRDLIAGVMTAREALLGFPQERLDAVCAAVAEEGAANARRLAELAVRETGFGRVEDKVLKNLLGSATTWEYYKDARVVGILREDTAAGTMEIGVPVGIVAALIPSTNPTSTTLYKAILCLKAGCPVIFSPHPGAKGAILETVDLIQTAAVRAGAPEGAVQGIRLTTREATDALLTHREVGMILATGGEAMVRAAYRSGNPAIGVGAGNGPAFIARSADVPAAVRHIMESKTFDNGTICASEQSIVTEQCVAEEVEAELRRQGGYFLSAEESGKLAALLLRADGSMNPRTVGKPAAEIAAMAGFPVAAGTQVLLSRQESVGPENPYAREKLCPVLGYYVEEHWEAACARCVALLRNEGAGHTMVIHARDEAVVRAFALQKPVSRLLVNTPAALGGVGATTGLPPALTLGCGAVGGSATSDNVGPRHLTNIRRVAYGRRELRELRAAGETDGAETAPQRQTLPFTAEEIAAATRRVLERLGVC